jgi:hypothetical protein
MAPISPTQEFPVANGLHEDPKIISQQGLEKTGFARTLLVLHKPPHPDWKEQGTDPNGAFIAFLDGKWCFLEVIP